MTELASSLIEGERRDSIAIVGRGKLGTALATALHATGVDVRGPLGRRDALGDSRIVMLCVPDAQIAAAAERVPRDRIVAHCSGATSLEPLAPHEAFSLHPLLSVLASTRSFEGAVCAIQATTARAHAIALEIARRLGMRAIDVADDARALYHAAATAAAGGIVTVATFAERLMASAGVDRSALVPLVHSAIDNWAALGAGALTGPAIRGDVETMRKQRAAVARADANALPFWDALETATVELASRGDGLRLDQMTNGR